MLSILASLLLAAPPAAPAPEKMRVLITDLSTQGVAPEVAKIAAGILSTAVAELGGLTPVSMQDLRTMVELEGNREALGCNVESCLAEVASAMGSRYVIYGEIGQLGSTLIINLNLFDASAAASVARRTVRAGSPDALPDVLPPAVRAMFAGIAEEEPAPSVLVVAGGVVLGAGALLAAGAGVGAAVTSAIVATPDEKPATKESALSAGRWLLGGVGLGVLVAVSGGVLLGLGLTEGGE